MQHRYAPLDISFQGKSRGRMSKRKTDYRMRNVEVKLVVDDWRFLLASVSALLASLSQRMGKEYDFFTPPFRPQRKWER